MNRPLSATHPGSENDESPGLLIIITGPPGAGKSTVAELLADRIETSALVPGDQFFGFLRRGSVAPWTAEAALQNETITQAAAAAAGTIAAGGYSVVYDGVIYPEFLGIFAARAGRPRLHYALLLPDEQTCLHRVQHRGGHGFTDLPAARDMHRQFAAARVAQRHVITDPPASADATTDLITDMLRAGHLAVRNS